MIEKNKMGIVWRALVSSSVIALLGVFAVHSCRSPSRVGRATVTVYDDGEPMADRWVVFHDDEGRPLVSVKTGADGKATAEIPKDAMVTVAYGESIQHLITVTGVKPGDDLVVGEKEDEGERADTVSMARVTLPGDMPGATRHRVSLGVGETDTRTDRPLAMPILKRFVTEDHRFRVLGEAIDGEGKPLAYAFVSAGIADVEKADVDVPLPPWSTDFRALRVVLSNPPLGIAHATAALSILSGEERFDRGRREAAVHGETTIAFPVPRPLGSDALVRVDLAYAGSEDRASLTQRSPTLSADDVNVDLRALVLPRVSHARAERTSDPRRPIVRWGVGDARPVAKGADATIARLVWPATGEHVWTIVAPPDARALRVPELPRVLRSWAPDGRKAKVDVALVEASFYDGYADVKKKGIALAFEPPDDEGAVSLRVSSTGGLTL